MYQQFFNFTEPPFTIAPDPHFFYLSSRHQEGLAHLLYGINTGGGFVALTGEVGTGKTTLCQCLLQRLPEKVDLALVLNPKVNAIELLASICDELSITYNKYRLAMKPLVDSLNHYLLDAHAKGRRTVLMIDEAQNLSFSVLEQIRLLTNLETSKNKLLQIILVGQPELQTLLASPQLRQLNQRITARYHLLPLNRNETGLYIKHRLTISNGDQDIFNKAAIRRIHRLSGGVPRLINVICDRSLLGAYANNSHKVTVAMINQAAREIDSRLLDPYRKQRRMILLSCLLLSTATAFYYHRETIFAPPHKDFSHPLPPQFANQNRSMVPQRALNEDHLADVVPRSLNQQIRSVTSVRIEPTALPQIDQPQPKLATFLQQPELTLQQAFLNLLQLWNLPPATPVDCPNLPIHCLAERGGWRELTRLDRPAILEFELKSGEKRYLLLWAVKNGRPQFRHQGKEVSFSLHELLGLWQGYFLLIWQIPPNGLDILYPGQQQPAVAWLREQLDTIQGHTDASGIKDFYDSILTKRVIAFQRSEGLQADGIAGPHTLIHLQNQTNADHGLRLQVND